MTQGQPINGSFDAKMGLSVAKKFRQGGTPKITAPYVLPYGDLTIAELTFWATNLVFSVELYLKIIIGMENSRIPHSHDLSHLFSLICEDHRNMIVGNFRQRMDAHTAINKNGEISIRIGSASFKFPESSQPIDQNEKNQLQAILKNNTNSFISWRYLFNSISPEKEHVQLSFHHVGLNILCDILDELADKGVAAISEKYPNV